MEFIDIKSQYRRYKNEIDLAIQDVLDHGNFIMGPQVSSLEQELAKHVDVKHCIAVSSGTTSLHIALLALGIGPGDDVITVPFTWISSAEVIALVGAKPVFVDIDPETYNIDVSKIEEAITAKTKALIIVNLFGQLPDYEIINAIAEKHNIAVIEDAAQSFGAIQKGKKSCGMSLIGSTSFFPSKPLGCYGDGGALFTNDDQIASKMKAIRNHGGEKRHEHLYVGMNGRLDTIQAAILLAKLPYFPGEITKRIEIGTRYSELLRTHCVVPKVQSGNTHIYAQYTIRIPNRNDVMTRLNAAGIPTGIYYPVCIHQQPAFVSLGYHKNSFPIAEKISNEVLSLPMHPWLTQEEQDRIVDLLISM